MARTPARPAARAKVGMISLCCPKNLIDTEVLLGKVAEEPGHLGLAAGRRHRLGVSHRHGLRAPPLERSREGLACGGSEALEVGDVEDGPPGVVPSLRGAPADEPGGREGREPDEHPPERSKYSVLQGFGLSGSCPAP